ncbi:hypothetical protein FNV43_RR04111 [Rhamnella rubrinervis]|uniref:C3H1-type domain-containing protein n=1 Tax=Rhamnella rubrinervis TaxID=2594499 RepID=A0A8K0HJQ9_9ROSA|nr:hypothetical protein FNV43_RR04111 [Rhamnella rubrinervis]
MEEELLKRNTDCVYFLASPLTCKKGVDCEYRHSEIARLNPRDCWYWLSGNCLNPTCAFRHPPLEMHNGAPSESTSCSQSVSKTNAPCYFYFNGFCNKGDKCSFLHGFEGSAPAGKSVKETLVNSDPLSENKTSSGTETASAPINTHVSSLETSVNAAADTRVQPKEDFQLPVPENAPPQQSTSSETFASDSEDAGTVGSGSLLVAEGFDQSISHVCSDQSSEEQVDDHIDLEERWESSPGFDVLVDGKSRNMGCEGDLEYFMALDRDQRELSSHLLGYDFRNPVEYDPTYRDVELLYESGLYDSYDCQGKAYDSGNMRNITSHFKDRMFDSILSRKRKSMPMELAVDEQNGVDLRNHLRRRRIFDIHPAADLSRRHESSRLIHRNQERHQRHGIGCRRLRGNLATEVGKHSIQSVGKNGTLSNGRNQRGWLGHSWHNLSRKHYKEKRLGKRLFFSSSEVSRKKIIRERISTRESSAFSGPKTLAQIKEGKRKVEANGDCIGKMRNSSRMKLGDFEGPKPLSEILKDKRKLSETEHRTTSN